MGAKATTWSMRLTISGEQYVLVLPVSRFDSLSVIGPRPGMSQRSLPEAISGLPNDYEDRTRSRAHASNPHYTFVVLVVEPLWKNHIDRRVKFRHQQPEP